MSLFIIPPYFFLSHISSIPFISPNHLSSLQLQTNSLYFWLPSFLIQKTHTLIVYRNFSNIFPQILSSSHDSLLTSFLSLPYPFLILFTLLINLFYICYYHFIISLLPACYSLLYTTIYHLLPFFVSSLRLFFSFLLNLHYFLIIIIIFIIFL